MDQEHNQENSEPKKRIKIRVGRILSIVIIIIVILLAFYLYRNYTPATGAAVAASINGEKISMQELDSQYEMIPEMYRSFITKASLLEQMIVEKVLLQEAKTLGITVSEQEVDENIKQLRDSTGQTTEEFKLSLEQQGITMDDLERQYSKQLMVSKLLNETLFKELQVSDSEAKTYYQENIDQFLAEAAEIHARHILLETKKDAERIIEKLDKGEDFADLAKEYSIGPTSVKGGDLGFFRKGDMVKEFGEAADQLDIGEYTSEPVETQFGWHVIKREPRKITFDDAKEGIKQALLEQKQQTAMEVYVKQLRNKADVDIFLEESSVETVEIEESVEEGLDDSEDSEIIDSDNDFVEEKDYCFTDFGLEKSTVIFYYLDSSKCPQCQTMLPVVTKLQSQGYSFYHADIADKVSLEVIEACFSDKVEGKAPLFICTGSGETKLGEYSESKLKAFAESCS